MWTCVDMWKSDIYGYMWICVVPRKGKENEIEFIKRGDRRLSSKSHGSLLD